MKRITILTLLIGMLSLACSTPAGNDEQTLTQIEDAWAQALLKADLPTLDGILASDYVFTGAEGEVQTKTQSMDELKNGVLKFTAFAVDDMNVRVFGDTAVVTGRSTEEGIERGKDISGQDRWTDVFVRRDGRWQAIATHSSRVKPTDVAWEIGVWKLNLAKSTFEGPPPQSVTLTWEDRGDGAQVYTTEGIDAKGRPTFNSYTYKYDGTDYPSPDTGVGTIGPTTNAYKRLDAYTVEVTAKRRGGPVTGVSTRTLSQDRKSMTYRAEGRKYVVVFDKQ